VRAAGCCGDPVGANGVGGIRSEGRRGAGSVWVRQHKLGMFGSARLGDRKLRGDCSSGDGMRPFGKRALVESEEDINCYQSFMQLRRDSCFFCSSSTY